MSTPPAGFEGHSEPILASMGCPKLTAALARAQGKFPPITKGKTARVKMREGGEYVYKYADLADIIAAVQPVLSEEGIAWTQDAKTIMQTGEVSPNVQLNAAYVSVTTTLRCEDESLDFGPLLLPVTNQTPQGFGSAETYARRYGFTAAIGVASEVDDDGELGAAAGSTKDRSRKASETQMKRLHALGAQKGKTHEQLRDWAGKNLGIESLSELTSAGAKKMMVSLEAEPDVAPSGPEDAEGHPDGSGDATTDPKAEKAERDAVYHEAKAIAGSAKDLLDWYRDHFHIEGALSTRTMTTANLRALIEEMKMVKGDGY